MNPYRKNERPEDWPPPEVPPKTPDELSQEIRAYLAKKYLVRDPDTILFECIAPGRCKKHGGRFHMGMCIIL